MTGSSQRLTHCANQTLEQWELNHLPFPFPFPFSIWWREKDTWWPSKAIMDEYKGFSEEMAEFTSTQRIQPIYRWRGRAKPSPIQNFQSLISRFTSEIFGLPRWNNINRRSHTISVIMAPGSEEASVTNFKKINWSAASCQPTARSSSQFRWSTFNF